MVYLHPCELAREVVGTSEEFPEAGTLRSRASSLGQGLCSGTGNSTLGVIGAPVVFDVHDPCGSVVLPDVSVHRP